MHQESVSNRGCLDVVPGLLIVHAHSHMGACWLIVALRQQGLCIILHGERNVMAMERQNTLDKVSRGSS